MQMFPSALINCSQFCNNWSQFCSRYLTWWWSSHALSSCVFLQPLFLSGTMRRRLSFMANTVSTLTSPTSDPRVPAVWTGPRWWWRTSKILTIFLQRNFSPFSTTTERNLTIICFLTGGLVFVSTNFVAGKDTANNFSSLTAGRSMGL